LVLDAALEAQVHGLDLVSGTGQVGPAGVVARKSAKSGQ
jgi:hypothetical protein